MSSRIPRPASRGPLAPLDPNRQQGETQQSKTAKMKVGDKRARSDAQPARSLQDQEGWEEISAATGLTIQGLLDTKMTGKSKHDLKGRLEQCMGYIKQLRACVTYLDTETQMLEADRESLENTIESLHAEKQAEAQAAAKELDKTLSDLQEQRDALDTAQQEIGAKEEKIDSLREAVRQGEQASERASDRLANVQKELDRLTPQLEEAQHQISHSQEQYNKAQEYIANLQEYNAQKQRESIALNTEKQALQEDHKALGAEAARLNAANTVLQAQIDAIQASLHDAENTRVEVQEDCTRLRTELVNMTGERDSLSSRLADALAKLEEYDRTSGHVMQELALVKAANKELEQTAASQAEQVQKLTMELSTIKASAQTSEGEAHRLATTKAELENHVASLQQQLDRANGQVHAHEAHRRKLHNTILEIKGNIRVFCRLRPCDNSDDDCLRPMLEEDCVHGSGVELIMPGTEEAPGPTHMFTFDKVFSQRATQEDVFSEINLLVQSALDGQKVCIFAYGQTGSGKTHTMLGDPLNPGMIPRAMEQIFCSSEELQARGWAINLRASMLEIHNEEYRDLLGKGLSAGKTHRVIHDASGNTTVTDLVIIDVSRPGSFEDLMEKALAQRSVGATALNDRSSRSHCVFTLQIEGHCPATGESIKGVLNLIDLAGSERLSKSLASGERLKETQAINKSLSALGDVICAIGSNAEHVPYRNSKLTWYLQPCLGGNAKTLMFVNAAPSASSANETLCSLRFATKVNSCSAGGIKRSRSGGVKS